MKTDTNKHDIVRLVIQNYNNLDIKTIKRDFNIKDEYIQQFRKTYDRYFIGTRIKNPLYNDLFDCNYLNWSFIKEVINFVTNYSQYSLLNITENYQNTMTIYFVK